MKNRLLPVVALALMLSLFPQAFADTDCSKHKAEYVIINPKNLSKDNFKIHDIDIVSGRFEQPDNIHGRFFAGTEPSTKVFPKMPDVVRVRLSNKTQTGARDFSVQEIFDHVRANFIRDLEWRQKNLSREEETVWNSKYCPSDCEADASQEETITKPGEKHQTTLYYTDYLLNPKTGEPDYPYSAKLNVSYQGTRRILYMTCVPKKKEEKNEKKSCDPTGRKIKADKGSRTGPQTGRKGVAGVVGPDGKIKKHNEKPLEGGVKMGAVTKKEAYDRIARLRKDLETREAEMTQLYDKQDVETLTQAFQQAGVYPKAMGYAGSWGPNSLYLTWVNKVRAYYDRHEEFLAQSQHAIMNNKSATVSERDLQYLENGVRAWEGQEPQLRQFMQQYTQTLAQRARALGDAMAITDDPRYFDYRTPEFKKSMEPRVNQHKNRAEQLLQQANQMVQQGEQLGKRTVFSPLTVKTTERVTPPEEQEPVAAPVAEEEDDCPEEELTPGMEYQDSSSVTPGKDVKLTKPPFQKRDSMLDYGN